MPLTLNEKRSGVVEGTSPGKLVVALEAPTLQEVQTQDAKNVAFKVAADHGFANAGMCDMPTSGAFHKDTGEFLKDAEAFDPRTPVGGYRAEFTFQQRL